MRSQINQAFWWVILSSFFCGLSQPLLYNTAPKNSVNWFPTNQRTIATTLASFSNPIGCAVGSLFPFFYVDNSIIHGRIKVFRATTISALIFVSIFLIGLSLYIDKPPSPPSKAVTEQKTKSIKELWDEVRGVLRSSNFWFGGLIYILLTACYGVTSVSLSAFLDPFNYEPVSP